MEIPFIAQTYLAKPGKVVWTCEHDQILISQLLAKTSSCFGYGRPCSSGYPHPDSLCQWLLVSKHSTKQKFKLC